MSDTSKQGIRGRMRSARRGLSESQHAAAADGLLTQLLDAGLLENPGRIAMYLVNDGEIDPRSVMQWCWENGRHA